MFGKFPAHDHKNWTLPWIFCCDFYPKVAKFAIFTGRHLGLQHSVFHVNIAKFLRTLIF